MAKLQIQGAARTVTGSRNLLQYKNKKYLVDCGLFQGPKEIRDLNWQAFDGADEIAAVILTHAHVDHCGFLPRLVKEGFNGPIFCTSGTRDLARIILRDSAHLQEELAKFANESGYSHHKPARPLYTAPDAEAAIGLLRPVPYHHWVELEKDLSFQFFRAGHILGSAVAQFSLRNDMNTKLLTFSGDLGNGQSKVIRPPEHPGETDILVIESTYGDRNHEKIDIEQKLAGLMRDVKASSGVLLIPSFSVGRTQELLWMVRDLEKKGEIPKLPVFVDSPMALDATEVYADHTEELNFVLSKGQVESPLCTSCFYAVRDVEHSRKLCSMPGPMVVISAAGMLNGGRILHHLKTRLPDPKNTVLFVGYQAEGTKGRLLQNGMSEIRIHHEPVQVKARIESSGALSAHADSDGLVAWVRQFRKKPKRVIVNHGENEPARALKYRLINELGIADVLIPQRGEAIPL